MARTRTIKAAEARLWLEVLLTYAFGTSPAQQAARLDLLGGTMPPRIPTISLMTDWPSCC